MEEAPTPINLINSNNFEISEKLELNNKDYELKLINSFKDQYLTIKIESINIENCESFYQVKYKIEDLYKLNKYFRQFDTIDEVIKSLIINENIIKEKGKSQTYNINFENSFLYFKNEFISNDRRNTINKHKNG